MPKDLRIAKTSRDFKQMKRGDYKYHCLHYQTSEAQDEYHNAGLVCWKDKNMVYCLSNDTGTKEEDDHCKQRSSEGIITLKRPKMISKYNEYMGGVDLADQIRLHSNSTIMGQNRWWLKLFFYLLDVGTFNALVLYNETQSKRKQMNLVQFKSQLLESFIGDRIQQIPKCPTNHATIRMNTRRRCVYCAVYSKVKRTRFMCKECLVPLCSMGSGKCGMDCFTAAHKNETIQKIILNKFSTMQVRTNKRSSDTSSS